MSSPAPARAPAIGFIFVTLTLAMTGFGLLIPVLPKLTVELNGGDLTEGSHAYGWLVSCYALMQFVGSPILGSLSDRFGRRRIILIATAGSAIDYVIMANAPTLTWLFVARVIAGFTAGVLATANAYIADVTPPEKRAGAFGLLGGAFGIGFVIGPVLGGLLGQIDLRLPFWVAAGFPRRTGSSVTSCCPSRSRRSTGVRSRGGARIRSAPSRRSSACRRCSGWRRVTSS